MKKTQIDPLTPDKTVNDAILVLLNHICAIELLRYFKACSIPIKAGDSINLLELQSDLGITDKYKKFLEFIIDFLKRGEFVRVNQDSLIFLTDLDRDNKIESDARLRNILNSNSEYTKISTLLKDIIANYPAILSEKISPFSLLFPSGNIDFLKENFDIIVETNSIAELKKAVLNLLLSSFSVKSSLSVLEVGGGSGGLTWTLLPFLKQGVDYHFTDVSRFFTLRAETKAKEMGLSAMQFFTFDLRADSVAQGCANQSYDFILAYNVIHVLPDMKKAINNLYQLLKPGGQVVILEHTKISDLATFMWGTLPSWWKYDIYRTQLNSPLLSSNKWKMLLAETVFSRVSYFSGDVSSDAIMIVLEK